MAKTWLYFFLKLFVGGNYEWMTNWSGAMLFLVQKAYTRLLDLASFSAWKDVSCQRVEKFEIKKN